MFSLSDFAEPGDRVTDFATGERYTVPEVREYYVTLTVPVDAESVADAVEQFKLDVADGPDYVYDVDDGETRLSYDSETGEETPAVRLDKGLLDALAAKLYGIAHGTDAEDAVQTAGDRETVSLIAAELYKLLGTV